MKHLLILLVLLFSFGIQAQEKMEFVYSVSGLCKTSFCLHGSHEAGTTVTLLSKDGKTCTAKVGKAFTVEDEMLRFNATTLVKEKGCDASKYFLAVFTNKKINYTVPKEQTLSGKELSRVAAKVNASSEFNSNYEGEQVYDYTQKKGDKFGTYTLKQLKKTPPIGHRYKDGVKTVMDIITHKLGAGSSEGTLFAVKGGKVDTVSGTFSLGKPFVFILNKAIHVMSEHSCQLGCGANTQKIYRYRNSRGQFESVLSNSDFST